MQRKYAFSVLDWITVVVASAIFGAYGWYRFAPQAQPRATQVTSSTRTAPKACTSAMRNTQVKPLSGIEVAFGMGHLMPFAKGEAVSRSEMRNSLGEPYCRGEEASDVYQLEPTGYIELQYDKDRLTNYSIQRYDSGEPN